MDGEKNGGAESKQGGGHSSLKFYPIIFEYSLEFVFRKSDKRRFAQRRKGRQVRRNRKIFIFALLASWRENLYWSPSVEHSIGKNLAEAHFEFGEVRVKLGQFSISS